jgi:RNA polymerase sigma-70 factor, ECF subfamily
MSRNLAHSLVNEPCGLSWCELRKLTDENLIAHVVSGHGDALAVVYGRYRRLVGSIAAKIVGPSEAEDVVQIVFLEILKLAGKFNPSKGSVKIWILQYAYHRSLNRRRYLSLRKARVNSISESESLICSSGSSSIPTQESSRIVKEALSNLTYRQRVTIELSYFQGLTLNEIAGLTGQAVGNVRHHYYRGLRRLRVLLDVPTDQGSRIKYSVKTHDEKDDRVIRSYFKTGYN